MPASLFRAMLDGVPPILANALVAELHPGERVLWHAMPSFGRDLWFRAITFLACIGIAVSLGALLWMRHLLAPLAGTALSAELTNVLYLFFGLFSLMFALFPLIPWSFYRRTIYAITDRRAIVIRALFRTRIQSFTDEQLIRIARIEDKHGHGDIIFERNIGFLGIKDTRAVAKLLRQIYEAGAI